jgi:hypothetical protein
MLVGVIIGQFFRKKLIVIMNNRAGCNYVLKTFIFDMSMQISVFNNFE